MTVLLRFGRVLSVLAPSLLFVSAVAQAATLTVEVDQSGDYPFLQDAIEAAQEGDVVLVGPGTYTWTNQQTESRVAEGFGSFAFFGMMSFFGNTARGVTIRSVAGAEETILDGESLGRLVFANGHAIPVPFTFEGFTFTRGRAPDDSPLREEREGGAVVLHLTDATFRDCVFRENEADAGGAIFVYNAQHNTFERCRFENNTALRAGGLLSFGSHTESRVIDSRFVGNTAEFAGALYVAGDEVTIEGCSFEHNTAMDGGGAILFLWTRPAILRNCWVSQNTSDEAAVSVRWVEGNLATSTRVTIESTVIVDNVGAGLRVDEDSHPDIRCTNVGGNSDGNWTDVAASLVGVDGNIEVDPRWCEESTDPYQVPTDSPLLGINNEFCDVDMGPVSAGCDPPVVEYVPPRDLFVHSGYPNPFHPEDGSVSFEYELPRAGIVRVAVYGLNGQLIRVLEDGTRDTGPQVAPWDGRDESGKSVATGVYLVRVEAADSVQTGRVVLLR